MVQGNLEGAGIHSPAGDAGPSGSGTSVAVKVLREVRTKACRIWLGDDGIVRMVNLPGSEETLDTAIENIAASGGLAEGKLALALVDIREIKSITREAREYYSGPDTAKLTRACAILMGSPISVVIGNFYTYDKQAPLATETFHIRDARDRVAVEIRGCMRFNRPTCVDFRR